MEICFPVFCVTVEVVAKFSLHVLLTVHDGPVEGQRCDGDSVDWHIPRHQGQRDCSQLPCSSGQID